MKPVHIRVEIVKGKFVYSLPLKIAAQVGRVVSRWASIERVLNLAIYNMAGINEITGRIIVGQGRPKEQFEKIEEMLTLSSVPLQPEYKKMAKTLEDLRLLRDQLAHGHWVRDKELGLCVLDFGGRWDTGTAAVRIKKRTFPSLIPMDVGYLKKLIAKMDNVFAALDILNEDIRALRRASQQKPPVQARARDQSQDQTPPRKTRPRRPRSSQV